jgi:hypothetical protein
MVTANGAPSAAREAKVRVRSGTNARSSADTNAPRGRDVAKRGADIIAEIWQRRNEPLVPLEVGPDPVASVYLGGIATLTGGTGAGKTSLGMHIAIRHAVNRGPAIVASLELPQRIIGARVVGIRCDESWAGVLGGHVPLEHMRGQWPERLRIIERRDATMENLHASIAAARRDYPDEPMLIVVDYVQIMDNEERDIRRRVARAMEEFDELANEHHAVVLALSQGSRASSRQLASGEKIGRETADAGAEAAEIERWSVCTIAIGGHAPTEGDWSAVDLSVGKGRIGGGDVVYPARYCGRTGAWRLAGDGRPSAEVKAERGTKQAGKRVEALLHAIPSKLDAAPEPLSRATIRAELGGRDEDVRAACTALLDKAPSGPLDVVEVGKRVKGSYRLWSRQRAEATNIAIVPRSPTAAA